MKTRLVSVLLVIATALLSHCAGQSSPSQQTSGSAKETAVVGGPFENGEFLYIGMPQPINAVDTSPGWSQPGQKLLITGTIYKHDGISPAPGVILYYYHTDIHGVYANRAGLDPRVVRHGYIRGWVKSDSNGRYAIYTVRPAPYPNRNTEAHIHPAIREPGIDKEYYIDEFVFDDDKLLTGEKRRKLQQRGGSGILRLYQRGDLQVAEHDIVLGLNIPNYPGEVQPLKRSGLQIGEDQPSFMPYHASGPDKGSRACPVCKYGRYQGILYFVGNHPDWPAIRQWLIFFEAQSKLRGRYLKVYFVYGNEHDYAKNRRDSMLSEMGSALNLQQVALTYVPSFSDSKSEVDRSKINPEAGNTMIVYRNSRIVDKFVDLTPTKENFQQIADVSKYR